MLNLLAYCLIAQTTAPVAPLYVGIRAAAGSHLAGSLEDAKFAKAKGFKGVSVRIGPSWDPARPTLHETNRFMHTAMSLGLRVNMEMALPAHKGVYWAPYASPDVWNVPTLPPPGKDGILRRTIGLDRKAHIAEAIRVCVYYKKDPAEWLSVENWNEVGWGGVSQPDLEDGTKPPQFAYLQNGQIPYEWFVMAFHVEKAMDGVYQGVPNLGLTLEGASGEDQRRELQSFTDAAERSDVVKWLVKRWNGIGFNCYAPPARDERELHLKYGPKIQEQLTLIASNPVVGHLPAYNQECNVFYERIPEGVDAGLYRLSAFRCVMGQPGLKRATAFCLTRTNNAQSNVFMYTYNEKTKTFSPWPSFSSGVSLSG